MAEPVIHRSGEGEVHRAGANSTVIIKARSEDTAGSFYLSEMTIEPGFPGPPPHRHERLHDMFYVLDGVLTMQVGDEVHDLGPGTFVCAPPGVVHTFSNRSDAPVRVLNLQTPGGWESYIRELGEAAKSGPLTPEVIGPIASQYYFEAVA